MLKVELTENYAGVTIYGDYNDLDFLYDSINYLIRGDGENIQEYMMQNHLYSFLYELRHAYQGQRGAELIDNDLNEYTREWLGFKKKDVTDKNIYFCFNYLLPDIFLDMMLIKYFIIKLDKKFNDIYNPYINMANYFYSLVLHSLENFLTERRFNKIKKGLLESVISDKLFVLQWFEVISVDYANMTKEHRKKEFMHIMEAIYNYGDYEGYYEMKKKMEDLCKEKECNLDAIHYEGYPEDMEW